MRRHPVLSRLALALAVTLAIVGCAAGVATSFDPDAPCTSDARVPGAFPDLEALVPPTFLDEPPGSLDSGRNCPGPNLGILADAGITELRFAGATWSFGAERAAALVVFTAPGLTADLMGEFYAISGRDANRTKLLEASSPTIAGRPGRRIDTQTGERLQTVLVWPSAEPDRVNVVITNDLPEARIQDAVAAFGDD